MQIKHLGLVDYQHTWQAMQAFTDTRTADTEDEIWLLEHPPVFTQGLAGKAEHLLVAPTLIDAAHSDVSPSGVKRWSHGNRPATRPLPTVVASGGNSGASAACTATPAASDRLGAGGSPPMRRTSVEPMKLPNPSSHTRPCRPRRRRPSRPAGSCRTRPYRSRS